MLHFLRRRFVSWFFFWYDIQYAVYFTAVRHVKELGLTTEQADSLLFFLDRKDAVINDLKDHLGVTHQTARGIVQRMESKGLVQTRKSKEDGRYQVVSPTQAGWRTGSILLRNGIQTGSCLLHGLTTEQESK